jgi:hypothetical protein
LNNSFGRPGLLLKGRLAGLEASGALKTTIPGPVDGGMSTMHSSASGSLKAPFTHTRAVEIITEVGGQHFDPDIVDVFLDIEGEFRDIALQFVDFEEARAALLE